MDFIKRPLPFVLVSSAHGSLIVNRNDYRMVSADAGIGVGFSILQTSGFDPQEVSLALHVLQARRQAHGDGVQAVDCGANIGVHTVEWARCMHGWGAVTAIEAQERIYYALAGNLALNNCLNARALHAAVSRQAGFLDIPEPDYLQPASFGSLELRKRENTEDIGQAIDYTRTRRIPTVAIDELGLPRVDFIKVDIEGMEVEALEGARQTLARHRPVLLVEAVKSGRAVLHALLTQHGYRPLDVGINILAIHESDPTVKHLRLH